MFVQNVLELHVQAIPLGEQIVQLRLAEYAPERRLRELRRRIEEVLDLDDGFDRVTTRKKTTAFTFTETLSLVMMSWEARRARPTEG